MSNNQKKSNQKASPPKAQNTLLIKILVPALIIFVIAGIWLFNNLPGTQNDKVETGNPDFALNVTDTLDIEKLKSYNLPILLEFGADWCAPCKTMAPIIEALNEELQGKAIVRFIDTDKYGHLASAYSFQYIPTQVFIDAQGLPYETSLPESQGWNKHYDHVSGEHLYTTHTGTLTKDELLTILKEMGME
ncbi:hypothetical protein SDC9_152159 [bioreactor metagenome]|uniref:Thioredoxin domain-containing protein n=1 Tax=bioreactor metagenome TaxID=1076179 RepID=A0A645ESB1_9ZZZZ